jgi:flavodoxin
MGPQGHGAEGVTRVHGIGVMFKSRPMYRNGMAPVKALVVYTSVSGNTKLIAEEVASELGARLVKVTSSARIRTEGMALSWGDEKSLRSIPLDVEDVDPVDFDLIVLGTPIWVWSPSPVIHAFVLQHPFRDKEVALFTTSEGDVGKAMERFASALKENCIVARRDFREPLKDPVSARAEARSWARTLCTKDK